METKNLPSDWSNLKRTIEIQGLKMSFVEMGAGEPIVFQHGNPTSSYLWRKIIPKLSQWGRCIAIDLVGMGDSEKIPDANLSSYFFENHKKYWREALNALEINKNIIFILHDWGSALGFDYFADHQDKVDGICHMEAIYDCMSWSDWPVESRKIFQSLRSDSGEEMVLNKNVFVEKILPASIFRDLTAEEMDEYRNPFIEKGLDRLPTLAWPRQLPIGGEPNDVCEIVSRYNKVLSTSAVSKLFINADPGVIVTEDIKEKIRRWHNQTEATVKGLHFIQEDSPDEIASAISSWLKTIRE